MSNPAWSRRRTAARTYQPGRTRLLLVVESPPADESDSFYFDARGSDPLFDQVCEVLFEQPPADKPSALKELRRRGVFVVELKPDAHRKNEKLEPYVMPFLLNLEAIAPEKVIVIGGETHRVLVPALEKAKVPVVDVRVPEPAHGSGVEFRQKFRQALVRADLERLIRPLKPRNRVRGKGRGSGDLRKSDRRDSDS